MSFDVVIIGAGSGGELLANLLAGAGRSVAVVEAGRVGGECPYVACMPSKALLRAAHLRADLADNAARLGASAGSPDPGGHQAAWAAAVAWRDEVVAHRDDSAAAEALRRAGVELIRGRARLAGPGRVEVSPADGDNGAADSAPTRVLEGRDIVIATGSQPARPPISGLDSAWTSEDLLSRDDLPESMAILGGGAIAAELSQVYARYGVGVVIIEQGERLLAKEEPEISDALARVLRASGVELRLGTEVTSVSGPARGDAGGYGLSVAGSTTPLDVQRLVVATGVTPALAGLGLDTIGLDELEVDSHCRVADGLWAVGDVTGLAPFTHTAKYQARVVAANLTGTPTEADYRALPRCLYTDLPLASVGMSAHQAAEEGIDVSVAHFDLSETARAASDGAGVVAGHLVLVADRARQVLVGAAVIGPGADEWIGQAALAVKAAVPLSVLRDMVQPFPTYSEGFAAALDDL